jgi:nicotinate-nucleotide pyrophosphorylase (carboxylating)
MVSDHRPPLDLPEDIAVTVRRALDEDVGSGDVTASLLPESLHAKAVIVSRENGTLCGSAWFEEVYAQLDPRSRITWRTQEGASMVPDQPLCTVEGPASALLTAERTALNFLQNLSGTATVARAYARAVEGTSVRILDTRKTIPGLRSAQKYAVRCGGCHNHRLGLFDGVLIKENHILAIGSITVAVERARLRYPALGVEVEVENLTELEEALACQADIILLDNFDLAMIQKAVSITAGKAKLEVSGNVTLETVREIASTGVDYISIGALTKHVRAIDLSMRFLPLFAVHP